MYDEDRDSGTIVPSKFQKCLIRTAQTLRFCSQSFSKLVTVIKTVLPSAGDKKM